MKISVACMKHVGDPQLITCRDVIRSAEHFRQTRTRYDRVLNHRIRRDASDCAKRAFPSRPKLFAFSFITRVAATARAIFHADRSDALGFDVDAGLDAV